jgi:hypothetical protein
MNGKSPTLRQKKYLDENGYCSDSWLVLKSTTKMLMLKHRKNGRVVEIEKGV